jgi:5'-methylthioadenosine phosphorylase
MTVYIKAERNAVAERAIISGDPSRINQLAEMLEGAKMISDSGGFLVYTGTYKGTPVTVATHGIGGTSASIIINDLISLGVRKIIRLGTAGSLKEDIEVGDVIVATGAH